jgi:hypothetical protein
VTFTAVISNPGNVRLSGITVVPSGFTFTSCMPPTKLNPGSSFICTGTKAFTQADMQNGVAIKPPSTSTVSVTATQLTSVVIRDATVTFMRMLG